MGLKRFAVVAVFGILVFILVFVAYCQELKLDNKTKKVCNQLMKKIYEDILKEKDNYEELKDFDKSVLQIRKNGIYSIYYRYDIKSLTKIKTKLTGKNPFQFTVAIVDVNEYWQAMNCFENLKYHNLKLKFYGFFIQSQPLKTDLTKKISDIVHRNAKALIELDRERSPLR